MRSDSDSEWEEENDPTLVARKRRMFARSSKGGRDEEEDDSAPHGPHHKRRKFSGSGGDELPYETSSSSLVADLSALPGVKKQSRYEPELPDEVLAKLSKEELSEWRKKARKVRNRESAAASRRKTRERIEELESEVEGLKKKYQEALERIKTLTSQSENPTPQVVVSPPASVSPEISSVTRSPPVSPHHESWSLNGEHEFYHQDVVVDPLDYHQHHHHHHHHPLQHVIAISRPTAVCV
jgi:bZIP transcription factor